jgi:hypothetical protein
MYAPVADLEKHLHCRSTRATFSWRAASLTLLFDKLYPRHRLGHLIRVVRSIPFQPLMPTRSSNLSPASPSKSSRRKTKKEMDNQNQSTVEHRQKAIKEENKYNLLERGEKFEKPDKPDSQSISSLPPDDARNLLVLITMCTSPSTLLIRFITGYPCRFSIR